MRHSFRNKEKIYKSTACVVDGKLILSLPGALRPVVWQMDMGDVRASALEVRESDNPGQACSLVLKTPKGEESEIAPFASREEAVDSLIAVTKALENARGQIRATTRHTAAAGQDNLPPPALHQAGQRVRPGKWIALSAVILGLFLLIGFLRGAGQGGPDMAALPASSTTGGGAATESGVPVSADDFLMSR